MGFGARHRTSSLTGKSNYYYESLLSEEEEEGLLCDDPDDVSPPSLTEGDCQAENNLDWDEEELEEAKKNPEKGAFQRLSLTIITNANHTHNSSWTSPRPTPSSAQKSRPGSMPTTPTTITTPMREEGSTSSHYD